LVDVSQLPALNASLNGLSAVLLCLGYVFIRRRRKLAHRNCMLAALVCSTLFLVSYLVYHAQVGSVRFPGTGGARVFYLAILVSHTILAATVPFLAVYTATLGLRGRFARHVRIAPFTLPIWLYVSATGVVVYWMLYRMEWA
jgi:uncharacterized membrane protein YozB (DUF420 family)